MARERMLVIRRNASGLAAALLLFAALAVVGVLLAGSSAPASASPTTIELYYAGALTPSNPSLTTCDQIVLNNGLLPFPSSTITVSSLSARWTFPAQTVAGGMASTPIPVPQTAGTYSYNVREVGLVTINISGQLTVTGPACESSPLATSSAAVSAGVLSTPGGGVNVGATTSAAPLGAPARASSSGVSASDSTRHLGVPAAVAIVCLVAVGGALGRVLLAQPAARTTRAKRPWTHLRPHHR